MSVCLAFPGSEIMASMLLNTRATGQIEFRKPRHTIKESTMKQLIARFIKEEEGQDLIEYSLLAALISVVAFLLISQIGSGVNVIYGKVNTQVSNAGAAS